MKATRFQLEMIFVICYTYSTRCERP